MLDEVLEKVNLHRYRAKNALEEIVSWTSLDKDIFDDFDKIKTIDSFIYRFIKLQDLMGEKLFKVFLDDIGEYKSSMSLLDMVDKLERFGILPQASSWMQYRKLRNTLTHEYPDNQDGILEGILYAMEIFQDIESVIENIKKHQ